MGNEWTLRARCEDGVLVVAACGLATAESLKVLRSFILTMVCQHSVQAILVDFTEADAEMDHGQWLENARETAKRGPGLPIAMVVRPEYFEAVMQHCFKAARFGLVRATFVDSGRALEWCAQRVRGPLAPPTLPESPTQRSSKLRLVSAR